MTGDFFTSEKERGHSMIRVQLQEMKKKSGLSNKEISEKSGVSLSTVNRIMSGQTDVPSYQTICDLVLAMDGSLDELAGIKSKTMAQDVGSDEVYLQIIKDKNRIIVDKDRWIKRLFFISCFLVLTLLGLLIFDYTHPMTGFFRG